MSVKVDTGKVLSAASQIFEINRQMSSDYRSVENAILHMDNKWDGIASNAAIQKYNSLEKSFCERRHLVVENMTNFMKNQVAEGYEVVETSLTTAAAAFK